MAERLLSQLVATWTQQTEVGFILGDPDAPTETRLIPDPATGVTFRLRWLPHRELRTDPHELERRGILNPERDEDLLFRDPRDPSGLHCFLCPQNIAICHPAEALVPVRAGGREWLAGANFAWLAHNHFTVLTVDHVDQVFDRSVLAAMLEIHAETSGQFRVVFNGAYAGATIPWHLHLHATTDAFPIEDLTPGREVDYPAPLRVFPDTAEGEVVRYVSRWEERDPEHHRVNVLVAPWHGRAAVFVILRDTRARNAAAKGLMGGWEVAGDFAYSEKRKQFEAADLATVRGALAEITPPAVRDEKE
ncbi:MAG: DUF4922 domain-containing protein [Acidimicrobiia bacterium]|nr:DUF4922 domain-containing protein [Acidimicrobiia bacterium]